MRRLVWMAAAVWLSGACATSDRARDAAFVRDARECEEDADTQLKNAGQSDPSIRLLFFQSCMTLRGWPSQ